MEIQLKAPLELRKNIYLLPGEDSGSHSYLVKGRDLTVLIDPGLDSMFSFLEKKLELTGSSIQDVGLVINTHEHFDHIGANRYFQDISMIAAHISAANKMKHNDRYVTLYVPGDDLPPLKVHLNLQDRSRIDTGDFLLEVIHTPGHTSGSLCIHEMHTRSLFTGDTLFAGGVLSYIAESGSVGDYIQSILTLSERHVSSIYPGHGRISVDPERDMSSAIAAARNLLKGEIHSPLVVYRPDGSIER